MEIEGLRGRAERTRVEWKEVVERDGEREGRGRAGTKADMVWMGDGTTRSGSYGR